MDVMLGGLKSLTFLHLLARTYICAAELVTWMYDQKNNDALKKTKNADGLKIYQKTLMIKRKQENLLLL